MADTSAATKNTRSTATIILATLLVVFSVCVLVLKHSSVILLRNNFDAYYLNWIDKPSSYWLFCCAPALLVVSSILLFVVACNKRGKKWVLMPLVAFTVLVDGCGWRCGFLSTSWWWGGLNLNYWGRSLNAGFNMFIILELVIIVLQFIMILKQRRIRALPIISVVLMAVYIGLLGLGFAEDLYKSFFDASTEIVFIILMSVYIILDYSFLELPRNKIVSSADGRNEGKPRIAYRYFCPSCGTRFVDGKKFCDQCGTALSELAQTEAVEQDIYSAQDAPSTGIAILGFLIPLAGFIMWVTWNGTMPKKAKSAGKGALIGFITYAVLVVASVVILFVLL